MYVDNGLIFSEAQAETTVTTHASTNVIDMQKAGDMIANPLWVDVTVDTTATSDGSATVKVELETSADEAFGTSTTLLSTSAIAVATLVKGYKMLQARLPAGTLRYLRLKYTIGTAALTAGKFNGILTTGIDRTYA